MKWMQIEIRKATIKDIDAVNQIYTHIHDVNLVMLEKKVGL